MSGQFRDLLVAELPRLRGYALVLTRDRAVADDLLQETALRAWNSRLQFTLGTNFRAWIYRILRNEFLSNCRRAKRAPVMLAGDHDYQIRCEGSQEEKIVTAEILKAMHQLPQSQREVLYLKCVADYSYDEAAAALQCSVGTIKSRLWRARYALQAVLLGNGLADPGLRTLTAGADGASRTSSMAG